MRYTWSYNNTIEVSDFHLNFKRKNAEPLRDSVSNEFVHWVPQVPNQLLPKKELAVNIQEVTFYLLAMNKFAGLLAEYGWAEMEYTSKSAGLADPKVRFGSLDPE